MPLDTTVGGASANGYLTVAEFRAYHATRFPTIIDDTVTDEQCEALIQQATREMDADFPWTGASTDDVQALCWPRQGMLTRNQKPIAIDVIPQELKNATAEMGGQMYVNDLMADQDAKKQGISSVKAGSVQVAFQSRNMNTKESADIAVRMQQSDLNYVSDAVPAEVRRLLVPSWFTQASITRPLIFEAD